MNEEDRQEIETHRNANFFKIYKKKKIVQIQDNNICIKDLQ